MTKTLTTEATFRRAQTRADTFYQFTICLGLAVMASVVGMAGAYVAHAGI